MSAKNIGYYANQPLKKRQCNKSSGCCIIYTMYVGESTKLINKKVA